LKKIEDLSWDIFLDNMNILKSEILTSLYDIKQLIPDARIDFLRPDSVKDFLMTEKKLKWIVDPQFNVGEKDYIVSHYGKDLFIDILKTMKVCMDYGGQTSLTSFQNSREEEYIEIVSYIFEGKFLELLEWNVNKGFGCLFLSCEELRYNFLLPLFVYEKRRERKPESLRFMKLS
jgi:hypothetical protein